MIIILNPGTHPEPMQAALGLREAGIPSLYLTASSFSSDTPIARSKPLNRILPVLKRRILQPGFDRTNVVTISLAWELAFQIVSHTMPRFARRAMLKRNRAFQRSCHEVISRTENVKIVFAQQTAASEIFRSLPPQITKILNYPIAHHRWLHREMNNEGAKNPTWAGFLQGHERSEDELRDLDYEVESADHVFVASTFVKKTFLEFGIPEGKISVIPLGSDFQRHISSADLEPSNRPLRVLFAGQMTQRKGIGYLVEAVDAVEQCTLTAVGSFSRSMGELLSLHPRVSVRPSLPRAELADIYASHDVLALPSLAEGFGLVAIEAMRCGTPCILTERSFGADIVTHGWDGFVIPAADTLAISTVLTELAHTPGLARKMGDQAQKTSEDFTWKVYRGAVSRELERIHYEKG